MHILITGGTGFIGSSLAPALVDAGHQVSILSRQRSAVSAAGSIVNALEELSSPVDAVVNLAGASLAGKRWNAAYKQEIIDSRIETTRAVGDFFAAQDYAPGIWLNASAIGYYGPRGDEELGESASPGHGFSADLCRAWEESATLAAGANARLCLLRLGVVLDSNGGAYTEMAQPFRMGIANWIGDGHQYLSWIHRLDVVRAIQFLLEGDSLRGIFNLTAPHPVTSRELCAAMRRVHRTLLALPMPAPVMRAMVGEMADELLITGQRVIPTSLTEAGFQFTYERIDDALAAIEER